MAEQQEPLQQAVPTCSATPLQHIVIPMAIQPALPPLKELWPSIDKDNSVTYIYILENTSFQAFTEQRYDEAISIFKELIDLKDLGYQLHSKPFVNYAYLGRCYQNTGDEEKAATCYDKALMDFSSGDKLEESTTYMNVVVN